MPRIKQQLPTRKELVRQIEKLEFELASAAATNICKPAPPARAAMDPALIELIEMLKRCDLAYRSTDPVQRLKAAQGFVISAGSLILRLGVPSQYADIATHLLIAFQGIEFGSIDPMFQPVICNRGQDDQKAWYARAMLVCAVESAQKFKGDEEEWSKARCIDILRQFQQILPVGTTLAQVITGDPGASDWTHERLAAKVKSYRSQIESKRRAGAVEYQLTFMRSLIGTTQSSECSRLSALILQFAAEKFVLNLKGARADTVAA